MHINRQIRDEFASRIGEVTAVGSVSTNRGSNLRLGELPAVVVGTGADTVERSAKAWEGFPDGLDRREVEVSVSILADGESDTLDDDLDALRAKIEAKFPGDELDPIEVGMVEHTGAQLEMMADEDGDRWFAIYDLTWEVQVWTEPGKPEVAV